MTSFKTPKIFDKSRGALYKQAKRINDIAEYNERDDEGKLVRLKRAGTQEVEAQRKWLSFWQWGL